MLELEVQKREILGKKVKSLRREGFIPAELYGHGVENLHLSVREKDFNKIYKEAGQNTVVNVKIGGLGKPTVIHDVEYHPLTGKVMSVDFHEVKMDEPLKIPVPIEMVGESPAVRDFHGILVKAMDEIEVEALPADIPSEIKVDISRLTELNQSIYVKDLPVTGKYKFLVDPQTVVVTVSEPVPEEVAPVEEIKPEEVVVEGEEKRAEKEVQERVAGKEV